MTVESNKQVVANFIEVCQNQHNLAAADTIFHPEFVNHYMPGGAPIVPTSAGPGGAFQAFYAMLFLFTGAAIALNFFGINPMKALVYAGIVQGISTPFLTLMIMLINNNRQIMGSWVNARGMNVLGWLTTTAMFLVSIGLAVSWIW